MSDISATSSQAVVEVDPNSVAQIRSTIDLADRAQVSSFGDKAQRDVVAFADRVLAQTRNKDMGDTGKLLLDVIEKARGLDPAELQKTGFFERLIGSAESRLRRFIGKFDDVAGQIERITIDLDRHKDVLRRDISLLDELYDETRRSIQFLEAHVQAGKAFVEDFRQGHLTELKNSADQATASGDGLMAAQNYNDAVQALDRLEKRVFYLQQARQIGIQQLPQIRIVQAGDETLIENLQATTQLTIPVWKQKMVLLLGLTNQSKALELQKTVTDATNEMMRQASDMMKKQAIEIEKQAQRGIIDMATLEKTNRDLIDTVNGVIDVQRQGRAKRSQAEARMDQLTGELKTALTRAPA
ncbi:toxic anion resistance protein [Labrys okinawensis]|uniref:toxic anion resistance protein n=1 Tax=Labrys okinawensis TaxID=346911 RepID=UPI0039BC2C03